MPYPRWLPLAIAAFFAACSSPETHGKGGGGAGTGGTTSTGGGVQTGGAGGTGATGTAGSAGNTGGAPTGGAGGAGTGGVATGGTGGTGTGGTGTGGAVTCPELGDPDCSPGDGTGNADQCFDAVSCYLKVVQNAVNFVINAQHPEWVDWSDGNPRILDANQNDYVLAVVDEVSLQGLCAIQDPNAGDEIVVKHDNDFAENFDILTAQGYARYGPNIHTATCAPAWF